VVQADAEVEAATSGKSEQLETMLLSAAQAVLNHERDWKYKNIKQELVETARSGDVSRDQQQQLLRRIDEHHRSRAGG